MVNKVCLKCTILVSEAGKSIVWSNDEIPKILERNFICPYCQEKFTFLQGNDSCRYNTVDFELSEERIEYLTKERQIEVDARNYMQLEGMLLEDQESIERNGEVTETIDNDNDEDYEDATYDNQSIHVPSEMRLRSYTNRDDVIPLVCVNEVASIDQINIIMRQYVEDLPHKTLAENVSGAEDMICIVTKTFRLFEEEISRLEEECRKRPRIT